MKIVTQSEREAANNALHAEAKRLRAEMTKEQLARLHRLPHQGNRETGRRLRQAPKLLAKRRMRWNTIHDAATCDACSERDGLRGHVPPHPGCTNPDGCRCTLIP